MPWLGLLTPPKSELGRFSRWLPERALLVSLAGALLTWSPAIAQTKCEQPPASLVCQGDQIVWVNIPSKVYHLKGQRYFGCTRNGKFMCQGDADREGDRGNLNGQ